MIKIQELKEFVNSLTLPGFKMTKGNSGFLWRTESETSVFEIGVSYYKGSESYSLQSPTARLTNKEFSIKLCKIMEAFSDDFSILNCSINYVIYPDQQINIEVFKTKITDRASFDIVATEFKKALNSGVLPFFEKMSSIEKVASNFAELSMEEIAEYVPGYRLFPFTALALKESRHPKFGKKVIQLLERAKEFEYDDDIQIYTKATEHILRM